MDSRSNPTVVHLTLRQSKTNVFGPGVTLHLGPLCAQSQPDQPILQLDIQHQAHYSISPQVNHCHGLPSSQSIRHTLRCRLGRIPYQRAQFSHYRAATAAAQAGILILLSSLWVDGGLVPSLGICNLRYAVILRNQGVFYSYKHEEFQLSTFV